MKKTTLEIPVQNVETGAVRRWVRRAGLLLAALALAWQCAAAERQDTIVIVLDASGSMKAKFPGTNGDRMDAAKAALKAVIRKVPQTTEIGLLVFSAANLKDHWAYPLGPRNDAQLFKVLDSIECRTDTPLGKYIKIGADRLLEERAKKFGYGSYRLIIVTDGEAGDQNLVDRYTPEVIARGLTVDVIGVGMKTAHTLARKVHSYRGANDTKALDQALVEVLAEVKGGDGGDAAGAEIFAMIAPLPEGLALAMVQAVANTPNQPIGDQNFVPTQPAPGAVQQPAQAAPASQAQPQPQSQTEPRKKRRGNTATVIIMAIVIGGVLRMALRGGRRR